MATSKSEINEALLAVQSELKAPKGQYNSFGKYSYRSCEDILEAVKPLLAKHGLTLTIQDEPTMVGDWHYIHASACLRKGDELVIASAYAREPKEKKGMDDSQISGTASSYARKYALNGLFLIDDSKDADALPPDAQKGAQKKQKQDVKPFNEPPKQRAWRMIQQFAKNTGLDAKAIADGVAKRDDFKDTDEYWNAIADEFSR